MEIFECEAALSDALKHPRPQSVISKINKYLQEEMNNGSKDVEQLLAFDCIECKDNGPEGNARAFFSAPPPTVVLCANRLHSAKEVQDVLVHELVHAYDYTVKKLDITKPEILACSEIRSVRESECYDSASFLGAIASGISSLEKPALWFKRRCVRENAISCTKALFPHEAQENVDKVFEECFADKSPFDMKET